MYYSQLTYPQLWVELTYVRKTEQPDQAISSNQNQRRLVPRREVEYLSQLHIEQVLNDIREVQDKVGMEPKISVSGRMKYLRKGKQKRKSVDRFSNKVLFNNYSNFTVVEV